jgi:hypothetical protein
MAIFNSYVSLPEGKHLTAQSASRTSTITSRGSQIEIIFASSTQDSVKG